MNRAHLKQLAKNQLKGNWKTPILLMFLYTLASIGISLIQESTQSFALIVIGTILTILLGVWATVGFPKFYLNIVKNQGNVSLSDSMVSKGVLMKSFLYNLLLGAIGAIIGIIVGLIMMAFIATELTTYYMYSTPLINTNNMVLACFIIAIVIVIPITIFSLAVAFTGYILVDKNLGVFESMGLSMKMMKGYKWKLFVLYLSFIGWAILCLFTLGIGYLWLEPYTGVTFANMYRELDSKF